MLSSRLSRPVATAIVLAVIGMPVLVYRSYASVEPDPGAEARMEHRAARQEPSHTEEPVPGVTVTLLASETTDDLPRSWGILFDRVPLESGASMADALTPNADDPWAHMLPSLGPFSGPQLLYIEAGEVVVTADDGESVYAQGQQLVMPADAAYEVRNDTGRCASLLRLVAVPLFGGGFGANVSEPELAAQDCGRPTNYIGWSLPQSDVAFPAQLFIAEVKWDPANYETPLDAGLGPHTHPGPTGLVVDAGTLMMSGEVTHILSPGSVVLIPEGVTHSEYYPAPADAEPAVALMAGVVSAGMALVGEAGDGAAPGGNQGTDPAE